MEPLRTVTLEGGIYDGQVVEVDPNAPEVWAYRNMYNTTRAVKAGAWPRSPGMVTYRVIDGRDVARCVDDIAG